MAAESDALNNYALYDDIANSIGYIRIELIVEDEANTRDDFEGTLFLESGVNFPKKGYCKGVE